MGFSSVALCLQELMRSPRKIEPRSVDVTAVRRIVVDQLILSDVRDALEETAVKRLGAAEAPN